MMGRRDMGPTPQDLTAKEQAGHSLLNVLAAVDGGGDAVDEDVKDVGLPGQIADALLRLVVKVAAGRGEGGKLIREFRGGSTQTKHPHSRLNAARPSLVDLQAHHADVGSADRHSRRVALGGRSRRSK